MKTNFLKKENKRVILLILIVLVLVIILIRKSIEKFINIDDEQEQISNQDVIIDEESFMPVFSESEYNIYQGPYYGFGNLFVPDTKIYNK